MNEDGCLIFLTNIATVDKETKYARQFMLWENN